MFAKKEVVLTIITILRGNRAILQDGIIPNPRTYIRFHAQHHSISVNRIRIRTGPCMPGQKAKTPG
jgi:hypothetical protein